jgi:hypothetical protein
MQFQSELQRVDNDELAEINRQESEQVRVDELPVDEEFLFDFTRGAN